MQNVYRKVNSFILAVALLFINAVPVSGESMKNAYLLGPDFEDTAISAGNAGPEVRAGMSFSLSAGDHVVLGQSSESAIAGNHGYDFTVLTTNADDTDHLALLFYSDPKGIEAQPQQFDNASPSNPDGASRNGGCNIWELSDLYRALNDMQSDTNGTTDLHGASVEAAILFSQRLQAEPEVWEALKPCISMERDTYKGSIVEADGIQYQGRPLSNGEKVSLLSEYEYELYKSFHAEGFSWNDGTNGWWLKTPRAAYSHSVRYLYSDDFVPSLDPDKSYRRASGTLGVRPALRLDATEIYFTYGDGSPENPYGGLRRKEALQKVELQGELEAGQTLTAVVSPESADCVYRWYRGDLQVDSVTGSAYLLSAPDVGETIAVEAEGKNLYRGTVTAGGIEPVQKGRQDAPAGDEIPGQSDLRITSSEVEVLATQAGLEYGITTQSGLEMDAGHSDLWTGTPVFTGLLSNTEYFLYVRKMETEAYFPSPPATPMTLRTKDASDQTVNIRFAVGSYDPKKPVTAKLIPAAKGEPDTTTTAIHTDSTVGTSREVSGTIQAFSTTSTGIGLTATTMNIDGAEPGQTYRLILEKPGHAAVVIENIAVSHQAIDMTKHENPSLRLINLPCGDADGDGTIGLLDRSLLLNSQYYGKKAEDPVTTGVLLDFDGDGYVKLRDLQIMMREQNYGKSTIVLQYEGRGG